ncbi:hypothetical protein L1C42_24490 [Klebsiella pneumoniae]|uniref:hypothetical protein n=1 Tax=Klebsiella pneumoniae TaxID=573 RepID=UPI0020CCE0FC|nr:hypothetical protein [Klebsiella pneumoniae]MCQ0566560.1 hypothetical protein [Klebsiella pneumoniae]MCQ0605855.1 hypothetical protein [Klebsiella pneumoniae]
MNEQQVSALIAALNEQTAAQREQTKAIRQLAESNMALCEVIIQSLAADSDIDVTTLGEEGLVYLSQRPGG